VFQANDLNIWLGKLVFEHGRIMLNKPVSGVWRTSMESAYCTPEPQEVLGKKFLEKSVS